MRGTQSQFSLSNTDFVVAASIMQRACPYYPAPSCSLCYTHMPPYDAHFHYALHVSAVKTGFGTPSKSRKIVVVAENVV